MNNTKPDIVQTRSRGTMQGDRMLPALNPDYVLVDEKNLAQNIAFVYGLSDLVKLVDSNNAVFGSWSYMLQMDESFTLSSIATVNLDAVPNTYNQAMAVWNGKAGNNQKEMALSRLFALTDLLAGNLANWVYRSPGNDASDELSLQSSLRHLICTLVGSRLNDWSLCLNVMTALMTESPSQRLGRSFAVDVSIVMSRLADVLNSCTSGTITGRKFLNLADCADYLSDLYLSLYRCNVEARDQLSGKLEASLLIPSHQPHNALLLAFVQMMKNATDALNTITQRHLQYYYENVLKLTPLPPVPDSTFVLFTLAKGSTSATVPALTALNAGKGPSGDTIIFLTDSPLYVNQVNITQFMTVFNTVAVSATPACSGLLNAAPVANSADGQGAAFPAGGPAEWPPFGFAPPATNSNPTWVGLAFADPVLLMSTGSRKISMAFALQGMEAGTLLTQLADWLPSADGAAPKVPDVFSVTVTGEKGWLAVTSWQFLSQPGKGSASPPADAAEGNCLWLEAALDVNAGAIVTYSPDLHGPGYVAGMPVIRLQLNAANGSDGDLASSPLMNPYNLLRQVQFTDINVLVSVQGKTDLALQNDYSSLNPEKPFQPLGPAPVLNSAFYIGSPEVFRKQLTSLSVDMTWMQLPNNDPTGFANYYQIWNEVSPTTPFNNTIFRAGFSILQQNTWVPLPPADSTSDTPPVTDYQLFETGPPAGGSGAGTQVYNAQLWLSMNGWDGVVPEESILLAADAPAGVLQNTSTYTGFDLSGINSSITQIAASGLGTSFSYTSGLQTGFLRMNLSAPSYGFGSTIFSEVAFLVNKQNIASITAAAKSGSPPDGYLASPATPYVLNAKGITLDYQASGSYTAGGTNQGYVLALQPFGVTLTQGVESIPLMPSYPNEGTLYLGLANVAAPQVLTILVQLDENSASTDVDITQPEVSWSYLLGDTWTPFKSSDVVTDGTNNFSQSGIIKLMLNAGPTAPAAGAVQTQGGWFNSVPGYTSLLWLSASVSQNTSATCKVILMGTQAVSATYQVGTDAAAHLATPLPAGTITKPVTAVPGIAGVVQPMASTGGRLGETDDQFYTRVHERLRHKMRGITPWDIERILLQQFPAVGLVNTFPHSTDSSSLVPGSSLVVVFPGGSLTAQPNPYTPQFNRASLLAMQGLLNSVIPHEMKAVVSNPTYETLSVFATVAFMADQDPGNCLIQLNSDLCNYISPWVNTPDVPNPYDTMLSTALIRGFINGLSYVDQLVSLRVVQTAIVDGITQSFAEPDDYSYFQPVSPYSILTSVRQHPLRDVDSADGGGIGIVVAAAPGSEIPAIGNALIGDEDVSPPVNIPLREYVAVQIN